MLLTWIIEQRVAADQSSGQVQVNMGTCSKRWKRRGGRERDQFKAQYSLGLVGHCANADRERLLLGHSGLKPEALMMGSQVANSSRCSFAISSALR